MIYMAEKSGIETNKCVVLTNKCAVLTKQGLKQKVLYVNLTDKAVCRSDGDVKPEGEVDCGGGDRSGRLEDSLSFSEVQLEVERWRAARYREWEEWLLQNEMDTAAARLRPGAMQVTIRGGVRSAGGLFGVTQTLGFELRQGESVDLSIKFEKGRDL